MGFIDAVRAWLFGADDEADDAAEPGGEAGEPGGEADAGDADEPGGDTTDGDEPDGLDPAAATETRTATATDDAVDALRDVRRSHETADSQEKDDGNPAGASDDDRTRPPDDDRPKSSGDDGTNR
ncbi:hypothetical protein [Halorubrum trapanicum]|uniref:hypothetical protein n=1 Tax=Halorubrum trapanicum TaxID=29284 RepID=UPI000BBB226D|nr:hypothetical protein [Halorubrum trapanicum]